jgi:hypothetical protein
MSKKFIFNNDKPIFVKTKPITKLVIGKFAEDFDRTKSVVFVPVPNFNPEQLN